MNSLQIVENAKFGKVRFQMIENDPWFCAKDVCDVLGYGNSREALSEHVDKEDVTKCDTLTNGGKQKNTFIDARRRSTREFYPKIDIIIDYIKKTRNIAFEACHSSLFSFDKFFIN
jgi:hypothetical protein